MSLPKISKQEFEKLLKSKPLDNFKFIKQTEDNLKKMGGIFKLPKPGDPVILLVSGGLDSIVSWGILMEEYKLKVFPLTIDKGQKRRKFEENSVKYFSRYYKERYPKLYVEPFSITASFPQLEIKIEHASKRMHPQSILENLNDHSDITANMSLGSFTISPVHGKLYAQYLYLTQNIKINTIFCGVLPNDGDGVPEQCFTTLRAGMWYLRVSTNNYKWQFSSVCYEKETGSYFLKKDLVKWGYEHHIPLEKTWTCYHSYKKHCGECIGCFGRKGAFIKANIVDSTGYEKFQPSLLFRLKNKIRSTKSAI